jgi:hypothetical protein
LPPAAPFCYPFTLPHAARVISRIFEEAGSMRSPLTIVKEKFGDKAKLVEAVKALTTEDLWLGRTNQDRGGDRGLERVSNAKLLKLHAVLSTVKEKFGSRAGLIDGILAAEKREKDGGFKKRLEAYPVPRLYDLYKTAQKRAAAAAKAAKPAG